MIRARLSEPDYNEILAYLGAACKAIPEDEHERIGKCLDLVLKCTEPGLVYKRLPIEEGRVDGLELEGRDIRRLLDGASEAVVFAATAGHAVDQLISRLQVSDMADAVVCDACASAVIENICNNFEADMREQVQSEGLYLTERYSPGYGDLPLHTQRSIGEILNCQRRIGVIIADNYLMTPVKSVTAIMGVTHEKKPCVIHRCETCTSRDTCRLREAREQLKKN